MNDNNDHFQEDANEEKAHRIAYLLTGYIRRTLTDAEYDELKKWAVANQENTDLFAEMTDEKNIEAELKKRNVYDPHKALDRLRGKIGIQEKKPKKIRYWTYGIAASLLLLAGLFFLVPVIQKKKVAPTIAIEKPDLQPGGDKATLTLADGKIIVLDSMKGDIVNNAGLKVINLNGKLEYEGQTSEIAWHTLTTPKGGQYKLVLPDGSAVWLNAASSISYPTAFTDERKVSITGEAYFEVTKDPAKKFIVEANGMTTEVLGTHFNINSYSDEENKKVTLFEGTVKVSELTTHNSQLLKPGQQALLTHDSRLTTQNSVDLEEILAWKNGLFEFKDEPIESIMRQVARWYDVEIKYEGKVDYHFYASVERKVPVSKLFHYLEETDRVHFEIKDKTIIVKP